MFIIHGHYPWKKKRGLVAEFCETCQCIQPFAVIDLFHYLHVYFIPIWRSLHSSSVQCTACLTSVKLEADDFTAIVLENDKQHHPLEHLLPRTNALLHRIVQIESQLAEVEDPDEAPPLDLILTLYHCYRDESVQEAIADVTRWHALDEEQRQGLREAIDQVGFVRYKEARAKPFLERIVKKLYLKFHNLQVISLVVTLVVLFFVGYAAIQSFLPRAWNWMVIPLMFIYLAICLGVVWFLIWLYRRAFRRFIQHVMIPAAREEGVDLIALGSVMARIDNGQETCKEEKVKQLAAYWKLYAEVLTAEGQDASAASEGAMTHPI